MLGEKVTLWTIANVVYFDQLLGAQALMTLEVLFSSSFDVFSDKKENKRHIVIESQLLKAYQH